MALGASYGGFMVNWINGHNAFGFKALVYHDGMLSTTDTFFSTEEVGVAFAKFADGSCGSRCASSKGRPSMRATTTSAGTR